MPEAVYTPEQLEKSFALSGLFERKGWNEAKSEFSGLGEPAVCRAPAPRPRQSRLCPQRVRDVALRCTAALVVVV